MGIKIIRNFSFYVFSFSIFASLPLSASCQYSQSMTEEQALQELRRMAKDGNLPQESLLQQIETRFSNKRSGSLAKIMRARIRLQANDPASAAQFLNSSAFKEKTALADYALWLRGKALHQSGNYAQAISVYRQLVAEYPNSLRLRDAKFGLAESLISSGQGQEAENALREYSSKNDPAALLLIARSKAQSDQAGAINFYRKAYFYGAGGKEAKEAEGALAAFGVVLPLAPLNAEEALARADKFLQAKNFAEAYNAYSSLAAAFPGALDPAVNLRRMASLIGLKRMPEAQGIFNMVPASANEKAEAYSQLAKGYAGARSWQQAKETLNQMRQAFPQSPLTAKSWVEVGLMARDAKNRTDEIFLLNTAINSFPTQIDVAKVQFELAWAEHDAKNYTRSSQMLTEHLARYAAKDTTYRGRAGYWAARDSQQAGKIAEACILYEAMMARYDANWYGYLSNQRLTALKAQGQCKATQAPQMVADAAKNLKLVTVYPETATTKEQDRIAKADDLSTIGIFDWALDELNDAAKTAPNSPKINYGLAQLYRRKEDNASALLALARSYPDYSQMKPEEMSKEAWEIFYPLNNWGLIKQWAAARQLDPYQVAGLIRQESVFYPRARSSANAFGLMQLLLPTAKATARKYGAVVPGSAEELYNPALNIELGTAHMRDQLTKYGRIEYLGVAYNAGPGRVTQWLNSIPASEMDEWVEQIPFKETKGYVQGITRNRLQYQRLYDSDGNFKANVGAKPLRAEIEAKPREQLAQELPELIIPEGSFEESGE